MEQLIPPELILRHWKRKQIPGSRELLSLAQSFSPLLILRVP